jgi:NmrA-like family
MRVCIVGAWGKLGRYMVQHALDRGYEVVGVCREESVGKLDEFKGRIAVVPGATNDPEVIKRAVCVVGTHKSDLRRTLRATGSSCSASALMSSTSSPSPWPIESGESPQYRFPRPTSTDDGREGRRTLGGQPASRLLRNECLSNGERRPPVRAVDRRNLLRV